MTRYLILTLWTIVTVSLATAQSDPLGPHDVGGHGCMLCHVPSTATVHADSDDYQEALWKPGSHTPERLAISSLGPDRPLFHTFVCVTCHDGSLASLSVMGRGFEKGKSLDPTADFELARANHAHPVHVPYLPNNGCDVPTAECNPDHWPSRVGANGALTWLPDRFADNFDNTYGRPIRFYPTGDNGGMAMVECSTCHNPHSMQNARYRLQGSIQDKPSEAFIRGWYETQGQHRDTMSKFCRSCHYSQSGDFVNVKETLQ